MTARYPRLPWVAAALLIAAFLFVESSFASPSVGGPRTNDLVSSIAHLCIYGALAYCCLHAFSKGGIARAALIALGVFLYGVSDELHQSLVPSREPSVTDAALDLTGALLGSLGVELLGLRWPLGAARRPRPSASAPFFPAARDRKAG